MAFFPSTLRDDIAAKASAGGGYINPSKLPDGGSVRFHILSEEPIAGYELWFQTKEGKMVPRRCPQSPDQDLIESLALDAGGPIVIRDGRPACSAFAAFFVYDYEEEEIRIFSVTQKTILRELDRLTSDPDYANLTEWDVQITRTGKGTDTKYSVDMKPSKARGPLGATITAAWDELRAGGADLEVLFTGGNPFTGAAAAPAF